MYIQLKPRKGVTFITGFFTVYRAQHKRYTPRTVEHSSRRKKQVRFPGINRALKCHSLLQQRRIYDRVVRTRYTR